MVTKAQSLVPVTPFTPIIQLVTDGLDSRHSRRAYERALIDFLVWYEQHGNNLTRRTVQQYIVYLRDTIQMSPAYINLRLVAVRRLAREAAENGLIDDTTAMAIERLKGVRDEGEHLGIWLTKAQAEELLDTPDKTTLKGKRDRAILATLIGCGLRREELTILTWEHIQQREGRWVIVDIVGKRNKKRSVPMAGWTKAIIDNWTNAAGITSGILFCAMDKGNHLTNIAISPQTVLDIVKSSTEYAGLAIERLAPHDLRRTFAKLAYKGGAHLDQISLALGHESLETTQKYLGLDLDFQDAAADHLGLEIAV
jgi:site-specific recombinase XerD